MNRWLLAYLALSAQLSQAAQLESSAQAAAKAQVAMVSFPDPCLACGGAIVIGFDKQRLFLSTAKHVAQPDACRGYRIHVQVAGTPKPKAADVIGADAKNDIALVSVARDASIDAWLARTNFQILSPDAPPGPNGTVHSIGCDGATPQWVPLAGSLFDATREKISFSKDTPAASEGQSGGGLFNARWELLGMPVVDRGVVIARPMDMVLAKVREIATEKNAAVKGLDLREVVRLDVRPEKDRAIDPAQLARSNQLIAKATNGLHTEDPQINLALIKEAGRLAGPESVFPILRDWVQAGGRAVMRGHTGEIRAAAVSPDGRRVVTASGDGNARIWDPASGQLLATLDHPSDVFVAAFDLEGRRIVTRTKHNTTYVWDVASGKLLATLSAEADAPSRPLPWRGVSSVSFSADGKRVLTAGYHGASRLFDAATGQLLITFSNSLPGWHSAAFSPDGRRIVTVENRDVRIWDAATLQSISSLPDHAEPYTIAVLSPDGQRLVTTSLQGLQARVYDASKGQFLFTLTGHTQPVNTAAFSPDGQRILTSSEDGTARIWEANQGTAMVLIKGHVGPVHTAAFNPDGQQVVTAGADNAARIWDAATGALLQTLTGHSDEVLTAIFTADGQRVVTTSKDRTTRIWDAHTGPLLSILSTPSAWGSAVLFAQMATFNASSDRIIGKGLGGLQLWNAATGKLITSFPSRASFTADGRHIIGSDQGEPRIWDANTGALVASFSDQAKQDHLAMFSQDGKRVVAANEDWTLTIWENAAEKLTVPLSPHPDAQPSFELSQDGRRVLTSGDHVVRVWDGSTGKLAFTLPAQQGTVTARFSSDGQRILTTSPGSTARIWNASNGELLITLSGGDPPGVVRMASFSRDGSRVVGMSGDLVHVWESSTGRLLLKLRDHPSYVNTVELSGDGQRILTTSGDKIAHVWDAVTGEQLAAIGMSTVSAAFSPDGRRVITTSREASDMSGPVMNGTTRDRSIRDGTPRVWQDVGWSTRERLVELLDSARSLTPEERRTYGLDDTSSSAHPSEAATAHDSPP